MTARRIPIVSSEMKSNVDILCGQMGAAAKKARGKLLPYYHFAGARGRANNYVVAVMERTIDIECLVPASGGETYDVRRRQ